MKDRKPKSLALKLFQAVCSVTILVAVITTFVSGFEAAIGAAVTVAAIGIVIPAVVTGGTDLVIVLLEVLNALFEGILFVFEGIVLVFEAIGSLFSF